MPDEQVTPGVPEGQVVEHGATHDGDVAVLSITDEPLDVHDVSGDGPP